MVKPKRLGHLVKIVGVGDHRVSLGVYLFDPEGNEIEVFYELRRSSGPMARYSPVDSQVASKTSPPRLLADGHLACGDA